MQKLFTYPLYLLMLSTVISCGHKKAPDVKPESLILSTDSTQFFDVQTYLKGEIKDVTTTPYFIYSITSINGKRKDSVPITSAVFEKIAQIFLQKNISDTSVKKYYRENVFRDLTTKSITMSYSTFNHSLDVQGVDILLNQETNLVKYVLIRSNQNTPDSSVITQLNWKSGQSFLINKSISKSNGEQISTQQFVCWNP